MRGRPASYSWRGALLQVGAADNRAPGAQWALRSHALRTSRQESWLAGPARPCSRRS